MKRERTRGRILEVAREVFMRLGYHGTSMRVLAAELGMKESSLYYHFPSKAALYKGVVETALQSFQEGFVAVSTEGRTPITYLVEVGRYYCDQLSANKAITALLVRESLYPEDSEISGLANLVSTMKDREWHVAKSLELIAPKASTEGSLRAVSRVFLQSVFGNWAMTTALGKLAWPEPQRSEVLTRLADSLISHESTQPKL